jgi:hypothetical protein
MFGSTPFIIQTNNDSSAGHQGAHYTKARFQRMGSPGLWRLTFGVAVISTFSYCSHLCGLKWLGRPAAVCALSEEIMNKGQLTALIVGGARVERIVFA